MPKYSVPDTFLTEPRATWRLLFLIEAQRLRPEILGDLRDNVLAVYIENKVWPKLGGQPESPEFGGPDSCPANGASEAESKAQRLFDALTDWARRFNLLERNVLFEALETLSFWVRCPDEVAELQWWREQLGEHLADSRDTASLGIPVGLSGMDERLVHPHPFEFTHRGWEVQFEEFREWSAAAREALEEELKNYEATYRGLAEACGLEPFEMRDMRRRLAWLARYQLDDSVTYKRLAVEDGLSSRTIRDDVKLASDVLGLPIRAAKLGRGKGSKDSEDCDRQRSYN